MPPKQASAPFSVDERVFCFHMDMLYEARVLDVKHATLPTANGGPVEKQWQFRIHYKGWKNTWDDWVPQDRVRKFNDENKDLASQLREQARLLQQQKSAKAVKKVSQGGPGAAGGSSGTPGPGTRSGHMGSGPGGPSGSIAGIGIGGGGGSVSGAVTPGDRHHSGRGDSEMTSARGSEERTGTGASAGGGGSLAHSRGPRRQQQRDYDLEQKEDGFHNRPAIRLPMPDHIKASLVDDWENITKSNQLVPLPHRAPVEAVLEDYLAFERPHREEGSASMDILEETIAGLREYFNKCLGRILLYRFERLQYIEMHNLWEKGGKHQSPVDTYGIEHLCRLLVSLPELIAQTNMDQQSVNRLRDELAKLTTWLGKNMVNYFVSEYETPNQQYIDKARSS